MVENLQRLELESAKRERRALMDSLAALKGDQGKAGSDLQEADISRLRRELEVKQEKINELRQARSPYLDSATKKRHCLVKRWSPWTGFNMVQPILQTTMAQQVL